MICEKGEPQVLIRQMSDNKSCELVSKNYLHCEQAFERSLNIEVAFLGTFYLIERTEC